jgi:hypothetical protein
MDMGKWQMAESYVRKDLLRGQEDNTSGNERLRFHCIWYREI